jgi:hypothetical protein
LLASAAESGVYLRKPAGSLSKLVETVRALDGVAAVAIYERSGEPLVVRGLPDAAGSGPHCQRSQRRFIA